MKHYMLMNSMHTAFRRHTDAHEYPSYLMHSNMCMHENDITHHAISTTYSHISTSAHEHTSRIKYHFIDSYMHASTPCSQSHQSYTSNIDSHMHTVSQSRTHSHDLASLHIYTSCNDTVLGPYPAPGPPYNVLAHCTRMGLKT